MKEKKEERIKLRFREDVSFFDRFFYNYAKPMLDYAAAGKFIDNDMYGDIPDSKRIYHMINDIEKNAKFFKDENPKDKYAMLKGILYSQRWQFATFVWFRFLVALVGEVIQPIGIVKFIEWVQDPAPDDYYSIAQAVSFGLLVPFITIARNACWEYKFFDMFTSGHLMHNALKSIVSQKNMRMSSATNKDYSEGEINSIMFGDTNTVWDLVWRIPDFIEDPMVLIASLYFVFVYMGWYAFIILGMVALQIAMGYIREKIGNTIEKQQ